MFIIEVMVDGGGVLECIVLSGVPYNFVQSINIHRGGQSIRNPPVHQRHAYNLNNNHKVLSPF